nr:hypothetical protein [Tanacetum cinerariifolium]
MRSSSLTCLVIKPSKDGMIFTRLEWILWCHTSNGLNDQDLRECQVILNGDSPIPTRVIDGVVQSVTLTNVEQRLARKNELKARSTLLMALPDKHQFDGNKETKKVHKTFLKQQYKNFTGSSSKRLDQIHDRLHKLISQLEILGESLSQEDIILKFLRSLPAEWRTHTFIWRNKTDLEDQSLDDLFNSLKIYEAEVKSLTSTSPTTQNIAFMSSQNTDSINESVSAVTSVSTASIKVPVSALPNVDTLSDAVIYSFFAKMDLKWQMAMLTMRAMRFLWRTGRNLGANGTTFIRFDMSKVECYNCYRIGHFIRECRSPKDTRNKEAQRRNILVDTSTSNALVLQYDGVGSYDWSFQSEEKPTNYALMAFTSSSSSSFDDEVASCSKACLESVEARIEVYQQNETVFEEDIKLLKLDVMLRDNVLVDLMLNKKKDELLLKLNKFQTSLKNLSQLLASQTFDKTGLGYDNQVFNSTVFDCDEMFSFESDVSMSTSLVYYRYKLGEGYHDVPPPYTGTFMPFKPDLVFHDALTVNETVPTALHVEPSPTKLDMDLSQSIRPSAPIIKDWVFDSEDESEENISYLYDFEEINRGYVAFGRNPKGGKITDTECIVLSFDFKLPDDNHATFDESNIWHRRLGHINFKTMNKLVKGNLVRGLLSKVFENDHTCVACKKGKQHRAFCKTKPVSSVSQPLQRVLVTKPYNKTPYELLLGRTPSIRFMRPIGYPMTILNTLDPLGKFDGKADEGFWLDTLSVAKPLEYSIVAPELFKRPCI